MRSSAAGKPTSCCSLARCCAIRTGRCMPPRSWAGRYRGPRNIFAQLLPEPRSAFQSRKSSWSNPSPNPREANLRAAAISDFLAELAYCDSIAHESIVSPGSSTIEPPAPSNQEALYDVHHFRILSPFVFTATRFPWRRPCGPEFSKPELRGCRVNNSKRRHIASSCPGQKDLEQRILGAARQT